MEKHWSDAPPVRQSWTEPPPVRQGAGEGNLEQGLTDGGTDVSVQPHRPSWFAILLGILILLLGHGAIAWWWWPQVFGH